ncbi:MAG: InlB B-repeat-containing protein, partial [Clostridia bacterium]|nr:InlB B-repeat-containing protein [Clostridia bacterium]
MKKKWLLGVLATACVSLVAVAFSACEDGNHTHKYTKETVAPTCTEQGYTLSTCSCGAQKRSNYKAALGHSFTNYISNDDGTCTQSGTKTALCDHGCGEEDTLPDTTAVGHQYTQYVGVYSSATCTSNRFDTYRCANCTSTENREVANSALGHSYTIYQGVYSPATCTSNRIETYKCANCTSTEQREVADSKTSHSYTQYIGVYSLATCTSNRFDTYRCANCTSTENREVPDSKTSHSYTQYIGVYSPATYTSNRFDTYRCACGATENREILGTMLVSSGISFKTLTKDGTKVYGKVSNDTAEFSFIDEVIAGGNATYIVDDNKDCTSPIRSKTVDLVVGDNTFYVLEEVGNDVKLYTVTIRRRPKYTVTFNTAGGTSVSSQTVEEDDFATVPTTTKTGYIFTGWNYDFTQPITSNTTITASWTPDTGTKYTVEYYLQNLENDNYPTTPSEVVKMAGTTGEIAYAEIKDYPHFTPTSQSVSGTIKADDSLVLKVYYTRDKYTVTFDGAGGTLTSGITSQTVKYGGSVTAPTFDRVGYTFTGYDKTNYTNISESFTV